MDLNPQLLSDLGIGGATIAILWWIVRYFVRAIEGKDKYIRQTTKEFTEVVAEHINHSNRALDKMNDQTLNIITVLDKNTKVINKVYDKLNK